ncbi:MAG: YlbF family regulator [Lachnospiraceae bacterium]|nr:YlbF family regulator [Lachnospiraceae bacterium]
MELDTALKQFISVLMDSKEFKRYEYQKEKIKKNPQLREQINSFRQQRLEFQTYEGEDLFEKIDEFEAAHENFKGKPAVREYLNAELEVCRMVQHIYHVIAEAVDVDMETDFM